MVHSAHVPRPAPFFPRLDGHEVAVLQAAASVPVSPPRRADHDPRAAPARSLPSRAILDSPGPARGAGVGGRVHELKGGEWRGSSEWWAWEKARAHLGPGPVWP